jgi:hypothetical protein
VKQQQRRAGAADHASEANAACVDIQGAETWKERWRGLAGDRCCRLSCNGGDGSTACRFGAPIMRFHRVTNLFIDR